MKMYWVNDDYFRVVLCEIRKPGEYISEVSIEVDSVKLKDFALTMDLYQTEQDAKNALKRKLVDSIADDRKAIEQLQEEIVRKEKKLAILRGEHEPSLPRICE